MDAGLELLRLLDVELPADPGEADVGAAFQAATEQLASLGAGGLEGLSDAADARVVAAMRVQARICSAARP